MMMLPLPPVRTVAPSVQPLTLAEVRDHLRLENVAGEDALLTAYIAAAAGKLDGWRGYLGRCLIMQTWRQDYACFSAGGFLRLPFPDASSVAVTYLDTSGDVQTLATTDYLLVNDYIGGAVVMVGGIAWPSAVATRPDAVSVTGVYGYGESAASIPAEIRHAMLLIVGDMYAHRETAVVGATAAAVPMSMTVRSLLAGHESVMV